MMMKRCKLLALLCALMMGLGLCGGVAGADGPNAETAVVAYVYFVYVPESGGTYWLHANIAKGGVLSYADASFSPAYYQMGEEVALIAHNVGNTWYRITYNDGTMPGGCLRSIASHNNRGG